MSWAQVRRHRHQRLRRAMFRYKALARAKQVWVWFDPQWLRRVRERARERARRLGLDESLDQMRRGEGVRLR